MYRIFVCILLFLNAVSVVACAGQEYILDVDTTDINAYVSGVTDNLLDFDVLMEYVQKGEVKAAVKILAEYTYESIKRTLVNHKLIMSTILTVCLLSALPRFAADDDFGKIYELTAVCALSALMIGVFSSVFDVVTDVVKNLAGFMNVSLPVYFGISASVTSRLPFSVYGAFVAFVAFFQWGANAVLFPAIGVMALCSIAEGVYPSFGAAGIKKFITSTVHWALGLYTTVFVAIMKITQLASYGTDKLIMSGIRYTISHSVPVVGGFLSEAAGAVVTSTLILHNTLGVGSVLIIAFIGFAPFLAVFALSGIIKLIAAALSPLAAAGVVGLLQSFGECLCELSVVLLCACATFIIGLGIEMSVVR